VSELKIKIRDYYDLRPKDYHVMQSITLSQSLGSTGVCEQTLSLVLKKEAVSAARLHLEFYGVRNLLLQQPEWSLITMGLLDISMPTGLQDFENGLLVRDLDQERIISFECRDFHAHVET
jgi:hypothetical protein